MIYLKLDVLVFSAIILIITYINFSRYQKEANDYLQFLKATTVCLIQILIIDIFVTIFENNLLNNLFVNITKLLITFNAILTPLASWTWTLFLLYYLRPNNKNNKTYSIITSIPFIFNLATPTLRLVTVKKLTSPI